MPNPVVHFEIGGVDAAGLQRFYAGAFDVTLANGNGGGDDGGQGFPGGPIGSFP